MVTVIDDTGTRHQLEGTPAHIVATLCEGVRLLPVAGKYQVEFDCADAEVVMRPRLSFRRGNPHPNPPPLRRGGGEQ